MGYSPYRSERGYTTEIIFRKPQWNRIRYTDVGRLEYLVRFFQIFFVNFGCWYRKIKFQNLAIVLVGPKAVKSNFEATRENK
jgi:hypothetical protein